MQAEAGRRDMVTVESRRPPFDLDAECAVLSSVMVDPSAFDKVAEHLRPEDFYSEAHRRIFEAHVALALANIPIDVVQTATWLRDHERLAQVGGVAYLTETLNAAPAVANVEAYASTVRDKSTARKALRVCQKYTAVGYSAYGTAVEYINSISSEIHEIACSDQRSSYEKIGPIIQQNIQAAADASKAGKSVTGLPTYLDRYDRLTSGMHNGELTIVAARPGLGKTSLALNIALNVATAPAPVGAIVFSLEMPRSQLGMRILCSEARIDLVRFRNGLMSPSDWTRLSAAAVKVNPAPLWVDDQPAITLVEMRAKTRRAMAEAATAGTPIRLVVVDYLQLMKGTGQEGSREQEVSGVSRGLKALAKELNIPVLALAQLNRKNEDRSDKRPQLSDLRESGAIEQDADNIVFIYRDQKYNAETEDRNIAELILGKHRNGPTDTVRVRFDEQYTRFDNLSEIEDTDRYAD